MKVLITGSTGFIGSHLVKELCRKQTCRVRCMLRKTSDTSRIQGQEIQPVFADFRDYESLKYAVQDVDIVYHLGGLVRAANKNDLYKVNAQGTKKLVDAVKQYAPSVKKFVYVSSQAAYGPEGKGPVSHYGKSKKEGEKAVETLSCGRILIPSSVYGPGDKDFFEIFKTANRGFFFQPLKGGKLSFIHVKDCVKSILAEGEKKEFLSDGNVYSWEDVKNILAEILDRKIVSVSIPSLILRIAGAAGDTWALVKAKAVKLNSDKTREILAGNWVLPPPSRRAAFNLKEGFKDVWSWYLKEGWI
ncbi:MAG: NAD-dependent epimerase/dehydratase family protein [Elusimicrobiota bacterium]